MQMKQIEKIVFIQKYKKQIKTTNNSNCHNKNTPGVVLPAIVPFLGMCGEDQTCVH